MRSPLMTPLDRSAVELAALWRQTLAACVAACDAARQDQLRDMYWPVKVHAVGEDRDQAVPVFWRFEVGDDPHAFIEMAVVDVDWPPDWGTSTLTVERDGERYTERVSSQLRGLLVFVLDEIVNDSGLLHRPLGWVLHPAD
jgi:hypothetical protein